MTDRDRDLADIARCYGTDAALGRALLAQVARRELLATLSDETVHELAKLHRETHARLSGAT